VTCPRCEPHVFVIAERLENCQDRGVPVAVEGHVTTCGAKLIASSNFSAFWSCVSHRDIVRYSIFAAANPPLVRFTKFLAGLHRFGGTDEPS